MYRLNTTEEISDFVRGVTFLGTGGGGRASDGFEHLKACLNEGIDPEWMDVERVPDDAWCCCVFGMASIAPAEEKSGTPYGIKGKVVEQPMIKAIRKLEEFAGVKIEVIVPFELGGANTPKAMAAGLRIGAIVPDGDFCGRAAPELSQTTVAINGISATPISVCDDWGNEIIVKEAASLECAEAIGKFISIVSKAPDKKGTCAHAAYLMTGKDLKKYIVRGTLTKSYEVGKAIRKARETDEDIIASIEKTANAKCIFKGTVKKVDWVDQEGYMIGTTYISGKDEYAGKEMSIWFKNENHLAKIDGEIQVTSPDLIEVVDANNGEPITNTLMKAGFEAAVFTMPNKWFRTEAGIANFGPKHFGIDAEYIPVEERIKFD
jgi:hypothetical protein